MLRVFTMQACGPVRSRNRSKSHAVGGPLTGSGDRQPRRGPVVENIIISVRRKRTVRERERENLCVCAWDNIVNANALCEKQQSATLPHSKFRSTELLYIGLPVRGFKH